MNTAMFLIVRSLLAFYIGTSSAVVGQEQKIKTFPHECVQVNGEPDPHCKLDWSIMKTFCLWNVVNAIISICFALIAAVWVAGLEKMK